MDSDTVSHVVLSDLHLGAAYSVLTKIDEEGELRLDSNGKLEGPNKALQALSDALEHYIRRLAPPGKPPTLVLLGDIMDFAFSSHNSAAIALRTFVRSLLNKKDLFSDEVILVPGNHDHHLWLEVRDRKYVDDIEGVSGSEIPYLTNVTPMLGRPQLESRFLNQVFKASTLLGGQRFYGAKVRVAYPNYALKHGNKRVVMHHGHYVESMYRMLTELGAFMFDRDTGAMDIAALERQNSAWVEFVWSSLGSGDALQRDAVQLYELMQDNAGAHAFILKLTDKILDRFASVLPYRASIDGVEIKTESVVAALLDATLGRAAEDERNNYHGVLSESSTDGLRWYINQIVYQQWCEETRSGANGGGDTLGQDDDWTFIFGHTHKPFQDQLVVPRFSRPVKVFNSGGWTVDQPKMTAAIGAAVIFVSHGLDTASLRLFNQPVNGLMHDVYAADAGSGADNALLAKMQDAVEKTDWSTLKTAMQDALLLRAWLAQVRHFPSLYPIPYPQCKNIEGAH